MSEQSVLVVGRGGDTHVKLTPHPHTFVDSGGRVVGSGSAFTNVAEWPKADQPHRAGTAPSPPSPPPPPLLRCAVDSRASSAVSQLLHCTDGYHKQSRATYHSNGQCVECVVCGVVWCGVVRCVVCCVVVPAAMASALAYQPPPITLTLTTLGLTTLV